MCVIAYADFHAWLWPFGPEPLVFAGGGGDIAVLSWFLEKIRCIYIYYNCPHSVWGLDLLSAEHEPEFSPGVRLPPSRTIGIIG